MNENLEKPNESDPNTNNNATKEKNNQELNQNQEKKDLEPKKDLMKERVNELKSTYEQMLKLRKQNLEGYKKIEMSK
jgi:hypothetical protein